MWNWNLEASQPIASKLISRITTSSLPEKKSQLRTRDNFIDALNDWFSHNQTARAHLRVNYTNLKNPHMGLGYSEHAKIHLGKPPLGSEENTIPHTRHTMATIQ